MNLDTSLTKTLKRLIAVSLMLIVFIIAVVFLVKHQYKPSHNNAVFNKYIESYTSGVISRAGTIRVKFSGDVQTSHAQNEAIDGDVFSFLPEIKGKAYWVDTQTIEFRPAAQMVNNSV